MTDLELRLRNAPVHGRPPTFPDADVAYAVHETPVGTLILAKAGDRVVASSYADEETVTQKLARAISPRVLRQPGRVDDVRRQLDEYFEGRRKAFDLEVDLALASPFQRTVLAPLASYVPFGRTTTYGAVARELDRPTAARAVGTALGANPVCVILPCHRVVGAGGRLTGYAGGVEAKRYLLDLEAAN